jgi:hypothetical protein
MSGCGDDDRCVDGVWVHAGLVVVVHGDECPVGDDTSNADLVRAGDGTCDEVFDGGSVEELDVGEGEDFGEESGGEQSLDCNMSVKGF